MKACFSAYHVCQIFHKSEWKVYVNNTLNSYLGTVVRYSVQINDVKTPGRSLLNDGTRKINSMK